MDYVVELGQAVSIMTARIAGAASVEISLSQGEEIEEVIRNYRTELESRGHVTSAKFSPLPSKIECNSCKLSARIYGAGTDAVIYSDFMEADQCQKRQMNLHDGEV